MSRRLILLALVPVVACTAASSTATNQDAGAQSGADGGNSSTDGGDISTGNPGDSDSGAGDGGADAGPLPLPANGIFVSTSLGADATADGSPAHPYQTLAAAILAAQPTGRPIVACNEIYTEAVTLASGVTVGGGYDCTTTPWSPSTKHATLNSPTSPAVIGADITVVTRLDGIDVVAPDTTVAQASSIGIMLTNAGSLTISNLSVHAGAAGAGVDGADVTPLANDATVAGGAGGAQNVCTPGAIVDTCHSSLATGHVPFVESGAAGGTNTCGGGVAVVPGTAAGAVGASGGADTCSGSDVFVANVPAGSAGVQAGTAGAAGTDGVSSAGGHLSSNGFAPGDGTAGSDGTMGAGGGGGPAHLQAPAVDVAGQNPECVSNVGSVWQGAAGPGGGAGGCPGLAGTPGTGGGASIAIFAVGSATKLTAVAISTGNGGPGGKGTLGTNATPGGAAGTNNSGVATAVAKAGGAGGRAGVGGSGAGGAAIGIARTGAALVYGADTTFAIGTPGAGVALMTSTDGTRTVPASATGQTGKDVSF